MSEKTEDPTPRRLRKAREEGDSGASAYASQATGFLVAVAMAPSVVRLLVARSSDELRRTFDFVGQVAPTAARVQGVALGEIVSMATISVVTAVVPLLAGVALVSAVTQLVQTGGAMAFARLGPRLERLDPIAGLRSIVSAMRVFAVVRSLAAAACVAALTWIGLRDHALDLARTTGRATSVGAVVSEVAGGIAWKAAVVALALGALDVLVMRRGRLRRLRMSKEEVRREHRDAEGDPQLKAARERAHQEALAQSTLANVRNASVVVVNPTHRACALRYDERTGDAAPVVVAAGEGEFAARIVRAAHAFRVPVVGDVPLAAALASLQVGDAIPEALYEAVAAILREVSRPPEAR